MINKKKVIFITGAGAGIGEAIALHQAKLGHAVVISDVHFEAAEKSNIKPLHKVPKILLHSIVISLKSTVLLMRLINALAILIAFLLVSLQTQALKLPKWRMKHR